MSATNKMSHKITKPKNLLERKGVELIFDFPSTWTMWNAKKITEEKLQRNDPGSQNIQVIEECKRIEEDVQLPIKSFSELSIASETSNCSEMSTFKNLNIHYIELKSKKTTIRNRMTWNRARIHNRMQARKEKKETDQIQILNQELRMLKTDNKKLKAINKSAKEKYVVMTCDVHLTRMELEDIYSKIASVEENLRTYEKTAESECRAKLNIMKKILEK